MADAQLGTISNNFVDKRRQRDYATPQPAEANNYDSIPELKARLTAISPTTFTVARLNAMTVNDMVYALRIHSADAAGI